MKKIDYITSKRSCEITMVLLLMALAWSFPFALISSYEDIQVMGVILFGSLTLSIVRDELINTLSPVWRKIIVILYSVFLFGLVLYILYSNLNIEIINSIIHIFQYITSLLILVLVIFTMIRLIKYYRSESHSPKEWSVWLMTSRIGHYVIMLTISQKIMQIVM